MTTALLAVQAPTHPDVDVIEFPHSAPLMPGRNAAALVVRLDTPLVVTNREQLKHRIADELHAGRRRFVLDFAECEYVDSSGFGVLVSITRRVERENGRVVLCELNEDLTTLCDLSQMGEVLRIAPRVIDALAWFER